MMDETPEAPVEETGTETETETEVVEAAQVAEPAVGEVEETPRVEPAARAEEDEQSRSQPQTRGRGGRDRQPQGRQESSLPAGTVVRTGLVRHERFPRRSASVEAVQRRLVELGHAGAGSDPRGRFLEHTEAALDAFRSSRGRQLAEAGRRETLEALFEGTGVEVQA